MGPRNGVPAMQASRGAPRGDDKADESGSVLLPCRRWIDDGERGARFTRTTERRPRAARRLVGLKARNALIARMGLLGLLAQYHAVIGAADRTQRALEAERGALRDGQVRHGAQGGRNKARCGETVWHGLCSALRLDLLLVMQQRTIPLIVPAGADLSRLTSNPS
jgi:hypothetical protein